MGLSPPTNGLNQSEGLSLGDGLSGGSGLSPNPFGPSGAGFALLLQTGFYLRLQNNGKLLLNSSPSPVPTTSLGWGTDPLTWGPGDYLTWG
jgi:hypothetical protein